MVRGDGSMKWQEVRANREEQIDVKGVKEAELTRQWWLDVCEEGEQGGQKQAD